MKNGGHSVHSHPADKMIPKGVLQPHRSAGVRKTLKKRHTRKARSWGKKREAEPWEGVERTDLQLRELQPMSRKYEK